MDFDRGEKLKGYLFLLLVVGLYGYGVYHLLARLNRYAQENYWFGFTFMGVEFSVILLGMVLVTATPVVVILLEKANLAVEEVFRKHAGGVQHGKAFRSLDYLIGHYLFCVGGPYHRAYLSILAWVRLIGLLALLNFLGWHLAEQVHGVLKAVYFYLPEALIYWQWLHLHFFFFLVATVGSFLLYRKG